MPSVPRTPPWDEAATDAPAVADEAPPGLFVGYRRFFARVGVATRRAPPLKQVPVVPDMGHDVARRAADGMLMGAVAGGDRDAFIRLVNAQSPRLLRFTASLLGSLAEAEELVQEAFLRLWQRAEDWRPDGTVATWLHRVAYRLAVDAIRRRRPSVALEGLEDVLADEAPSHHEQLAITQEAVLLRRAIDGLPERQKAALLLCHFQELSQSEAAAIMGIGEHAYESLLARARRRLRETLGGDGEARDAP